MTLDSKKLLPALLLSSLFAIPAAHAQESASLAEAEGRVLVNKGEGLVSARTGTALAEGDRLVTLDKAGARVVFSDGCSLVLSENQMVVIDMKAGCKSVVVANTTPPAGAVGNAAAASAPLPGGAMVIVAGAVLAGGTAAASQRRHRDDKPISPQ